MPIALNCYNDGVHLINSFLNNRLLLLNNVFVHNLTSASLEAAGQIPLVMKAQQVFKTVSSVLSSDVGKFPPFVSMSKTTERGEGLFWECCRIPRHAT